MARDNRHISVNSPGAIGPARAVGAAIVSPAANIDPLNPLVRAIGAQAGLGAFALMYLPPHALQLNPMQNIWANLPAPYFATASGMPMTTSSGPAPQHGYTPLLAHGASVKRAVKTGWGQPFKLVALVKKAPRMVTNLDIRRV
ncbi:MAG: hypothetical protein IT555_16305 [Acetobacteraceae bacterium]|nr:hypothetical protein [Acetobacteraceae bacterium]